MKTQSNRSKLSVLIALVALATVLAAGPMHAQQGRGRTLQVPSDRFPTIQSAINAAGTGDKVLVGPGVYEESLTIAKRISLIGSGMRGERRTEIVGPRPAEVVDLDRAIGVVNYQPGGGGRIERLLIRGRDVGILGVAIEDRFPAPLEVNRLIIHQGGRGVAGSFGDLTVHRTKVADMLWHGVSIVQAKGNILFTESVVQLCLGVGYFLKNTKVGPGEISILNSTFGANSGGGILIQGDAKPVLVTKCHLYANAYAGIRLKEVGQAVLCHNLIKLTLPRKADGAFGDGIVVECSQDVVVCQDSQNFALDYLPPGIEDSARAGISNFSSPVSLFNVRFECNLFHAAGENTPSICSSGDDFSYDDNGGSQCGCDLQPVVCQVASPGIEPPDPPPPS